jgi:hypothetical protein
MKKLFTLIALFTSSQFVKAQLIDYLDLPVAGELWIEFRDTVGSNFTMTPGGPGINWDYSNSFIVHDTIEFLPQSPATAPANISILYPTATFVAAGETAGDYTFLFVDTTGLYIDGVHSNEGFEVALDTINDINYTSNLLYIPIPFQYGDVIQHTDSFKYVYPDNSLYPGAMVRVTYTTFQDMETEAQGSLITPLGNYPSVIRIKEMITQNILYELDSFAVGNYSYLTDFSIPTRSAYKWLKNGPNCLVMTADLDEFNNVTSASYYSNGGLVAIENKQKFKEIELMPNPVNKGNSLQITNIDPSSTALTVYDLSGRVVYQTQLNKGLNKFKLDLQSFDSGLYYLKIYNENQLQSVSKFIVAD